MTQDETIGTLRKPFFAPRPQPTPIPGAAWNAAPLYCLKVNDEWVSHILGVLTALDQPDTWTGTEPEIRDARQQVNEIMVALMAFCEDCFIEFRVEDCDLQYRTEVDGEWTSLGDVCGATGAPGADGVDGTNGVDGENGVDGTDGIDGVDGAPGADGSDCDCEEFNHVPTPTNPEGSSNDQTSCNIAAGISEYLRDKEIFALSEATTAVGIVTAVMGVVASIIAAVVTGGLAAPAIIAAVTVFINVLLAADGGERDAQIADDSFWNSMSCCIFCALRPEKDITPTLQSDIGGAIRNCDYTSVSYDAPFWYGVLADLFESLPNEVVRNNVAVGALVAHDCTSCECVGCSSDGYEIYGSYGTMLETGLDYIIVEATFDSPNIGGYAAGIEALNASECCDITYEVVSGNISNFSGFWEDCGENPTWPSLPNSGLHVGGCDSMHTRISVDPFVIKFILNPCP